MTATQPLTGSIYQINVASYGRDGSFLLVQSDLPRIASMGFTWILLDYFQPCDPSGKITNEISVNRDLGSMDDFISLMHQAHNLGLKVMMKMDMQERSPNHVWGKQYPFFLNADHDLNYANPRMRQELARVFLHWAKHYVDGCYLVHDTYVLDSYMEILTRTVHQYKKAFVLIKESENPLNRTETEDGKRLVTQLQHRQFLVQNHLALQFLKPGIPLVYAGQETRTDIPYGSKEPISWQKTDLDLMKLICHLNRIRQMNPMSSVTEENGIVTLASEEWISLICLRAQDMIFVPIPDGRYENGCNGQMIVIENHQISSHKLPICIRNKTDCS